MKTKTRTSAQHDANINLLCIKLQMQLWRARNKVSLDTIILAEREKRRAAQIIEGRANEARTYERANGRKNPFQYFDRHDIARAKHMRSKFRRNFR